PKQEKVGTEFSNTDSEITINHSTGYFPEYKGSKIFTHDGGTFEVVKAQAEKLTDERKKKPDLVSTLTGTHAKQEQLKKEFEANQPKAEAFILDDDTDTEEEEEFEKEEVQPDNIKEVQPDNIKEEYPSVLSDNKELAPELQAISNEDIEKPFTEFQLLGLKSINFTKTNNRYTLTFDPKYIISLKLSHGFAQAIGFTQTTTVLNNQTAKPATNPFYSHHLNFQKIPIEFCHQRTGLYKYYNSKWERLTDISNWENIDLEGAFVKTQHGRLVDPEIIELTNQERNAVIAYYAKKGRNVTLCSNFIVRDNQCGSVILPQDCKILSF
uniref:Uncharacterized protein n=1 Tax=Panagrolaimus sp. ES5 TaxID=591445 RepID=A0AC34G730_9BILA